MFLSLIAALLAATATYAQGSLVAVLGHEGNLTAFYGAEALASALEAATDGDVITLSSGRFSAANITKAVTIRGAGMTVDEEAKIFPTMLVGDFSINIPEETSQRLTMEGLYCDYNNYVTVEGTLKNVAFMKCRFYSFSSNTYSSMQNIAFIHCKIADALSLSGGKSVSFVNCFVNRASIGSSSDSGESYEFTNCVLGLSVFSSSSRFNSYNAIYRNCIICYQFDATGYMGTSNLVYRTLGISTGNMFSNLSSTSNSWYNASSFSAVFKTYDGTYSDTEDFELTDGAKATYLGDDGSEVGIHGGNQPFSPNLTSPTITKFVVAPKSTSEGKLSVDIEVKAGN